MHTWASGFSASSDVDLLFISDTRWTTEKVSQTQYTHGHNSTRVSHCYRLVFLLLYSLYSLYIYSCWITEYSES